MQWKVSTFVFTFLLVAMLALSIMQIISSAKLILKSEGLFMGGIYAGVPCALASFLGIFSIFDGHHKYWTFVCFVMVNALSFVVAIIATALISELSITLGNLSSCSYYDSPPANQCQTDVEDLSCFGDSSSYLFSAVCAIDAQPQYQNLPPYYSGTTYSIPPSPGVCWCVMSSSVRECVNYYDVPDCSNLFSAYPRLLDDCFVFCFPLIVTTALLFCFRDPRVVNLQRNGMGPEGILLATIDGTRIRHFGLGSDSTTNPSVMMVAANTNLGADIVAADAEYSDKPPVTVTIETADVEAHAAHDPSQVVVTIEANGDVWVAGPEGPSVDHAAGGESSISNSSNSGSSGSREGEPMVDSHQHSIRNWLSTSISRSFGGIIRTLPPEQHLHHESASERAVSDESRAEEKQQSQAS